MALRLLELVLPEGMGKSLEEALAGQIVDLWRGELIDGRTQVKILVEQDRAEAVLDTLETRYDQLADFRVIMLRVDVALPRVAAAELAAPEDAKPRRAVSRQELIHTMSNATRLSGTYITMVVLSAVVAAIGLITDNVAIVIAAMVIAPLLGANIALALATTIGDGALAIEAIKTNTVGVLIAFVMALVLGSLLPECSMFSHEILARTHVGLGDFVLALCAGAAGTLAFTSGVSGTLIGVMVAVALMPPLIVVGIQLGGGNVAAAGGASLLLATNVICLNIAAVVTFVVRGVRPARWWQADRAKKATRWALSLWSGLVVALIAIVVLRYNQGPIAPDIPKHCVPATAQAHAHTAQPGFNKRA